LIRKFEDADLAYAREIHRASGLSEACFPDLYVRVNGREEPNALFIEKAIMEVGGSPVMCSFLRVTSEIFVLVDHEKGTPEERWEWMRELKEHMVREAFRHGLDQMTAFIPAEIEKSFAKRLEELGFIKSPFVPYTLLID
jgi:hypothetical protein